MYAGATISIDRGTEGPQHDPYSFEEFTVSRLKADGGKDVFVLHLGLGVWIKINGVTHGFPAANHTSEDVVLALWAINVGLNVDQMNKYELRVHGPFDKCPKCGSKKLHIVGGFVGESMQQCAKCESILWTEDPMPYII